MPETPWRSLHPASLAVNLLPQAWRTARGAWPLFLAILVGGGDTGTRFADLGLLLVFTGLTLTRTVTHYLTLRYRLHDGRLELKSGLFDRQARSIDPKRIQNVELVQNLFHRASGLVELRIETAGDTSTEGLLSALDKAEAGRLRDALRASQRLAEPGPLAEGEGSPSAAAPAEAVVLQLGLAELLAYGLSRRTMGTAALLSAVFYQVVEVSDPEQAQELAARLGAHALLAIVLLAFAASFAFSAAQAVLTHFRYRLLLDGGRLVSEEGLTTRRRIEIPLRKVQIVRTDEPLLRRMMGYGTVMIETAGLGMDEGRIRASEGLLPMVERQDLGRMATLAIPGLDTDPWAATLRPAHPRALWRDGVRRTMLGLVLAGGLSALFFPWGLLSLALAPPLAFLVAWLDWKRQGWLVTPTAIVSRRGFFNRRTWIVARDKVQSVHVGQTPLMRWHGLAAVMVRAAGSDVDLPDLGRDEALAVLEALSPASQPPGQAGPAGSPPQAPSNSLTASTLPTTPMMSAATPAGTA